MKSIVLHDYFDTPEGGGRFSLDLARGLEADLAYGFKTAGHPFFINTGPFPPEISLRANITIPILRQLLLCLAFSKKTAFLKNYNSVFYSGSYSPLAVSKTSRNCKNIYYCHTPPRYLYDQKDFYLSYGPGFAKPAFKLFSQYFQV